MPDEPFNRALPKPVSSGRGRSIFITILVMLALAAGLTGWLAYQGKVRFGADRSRGQPVASAPTLAVPLPGAAPSQAALPAAAEAAASGFDGRLAALEQRLARLDLQAEAASGNAARAEGLLIAFAARRAIERGAPLGYLEEQLKLRFAEAQPSAVELVITAARRPVTIELLASGLESIGARLINAPAEESGWGRIKREVSDLFVIRRDGGSTALPTERLDRAELLLRNGQVEQALAEVERMPGAASASGWIADARRYASAARALDLIETTAILEPRNLKDGSGHKIEQPSPLAEPIAASPVLGGQVGTETDF
jgi:hypothetical protein